MIDKARNDSVHDTQVHQVDRDALAALYHATDGPNWDDNTGWLSDRPLGEWSRVTTDEAGRVIGLGLSDNRLSGQIPPELGRLSQTWNTCTSPTTS